MPFALVAVLVSPASSQADIPLEHSVPKRATAAEQLVQARSWKGALRGETDSVERARRRQRAVEAYRAVRHYHASKRAIGAEAAFRAGELLRAGGDVSAALIEFRVAREWGAGTKFRARAALEIGHCHRRRGDSRGALEFYLDVATDATARSDHRDDGLSWAGRAWALEGRIDEARRAWRIVATGRGIPLDRIAAFDAIALSWIADGDLEAGAGVLHECFRALSSVARERTSLGLQTRNTLTRMRTVARLKREIATRALKDRGRNAEKTLTR